VTGGRSNDPGANTQGGQATRTAPATGGAQGGNAGQTGNAGQPASPGDNPAPVVPSGPDPGAPPDLGTVGEIRRNSLRPPNYAATAVRPEYRNILVGTVLSAADRGREEGVRVIVKNADSGGTKSTFTDAFGKFAVRVADGDWTVNVTMPSGRVYEVSQIRVSNGEITDSLGRRVPALEITR
jgi:hypothetical protein